MALSVRRTGSISPTIQLISGCRIHGGGDQALFDMEIRDGKISKITESHNRSNRSDDHASTGELHAGGRLLLPSLCHAHVHLDKCFILQDQKYEAHKIQHGDFSEAMKITGQAKRLFEHGDLCRRGRRLIRESIAAGVTAMRVFVEADEVAELRAVQAALSLKREFINQCYLQICAFAQLALFDPGDVGSRRREFIVKALEYDEVEVVGSTPYVEQDRSSSEENVRWTMNQALSHGKHLDFHLDYSLNDQMEPLVGFVMQELVHTKWPSVGLDLDDLT